MKEVTGPIIATTAVLMAVFVPVAFIPGVAGRLYNQFALTVAISVGISAFNSLTLSPALSAAFLRHRGATELSRRSAGSTPGFDWLSHAYAQQRARADPLALGHARRCSSAALGATYLRLDAHPLDLPAGRGPGLFLRRHPAARRRLAGAHRRGGQAGARHPAGDAGRRHRRLDQRPQLPDQRGAVELGGRVRHPEAVGRARRRTRAPRRSSTRCGRSCCRLPDAFALSFDPPSIPGLGATGGFEFQVEDLTGRGSVALNDATQARDRRGAQAAGDQPAAAVLLVLSTSTPQFNYDLDRNKAKLLGLNLPDVFNTLQIYLGSLYVNDFNLFGRTFRVTLQADKDARAAAVRPLASLCAQRLRAAWCRSARSAR